MDAVCFIPDISHHQSDESTGARISIRRLRDEGATAVIARVGQGAGRKRDGKTYSTIRDRMWPTFRAEAAGIGFPILPYWYIGNLISAADNAAIAADWLGDLPGAKWMLDHEDASGDIAFYNVVLSAFEKRGLEVVLGYVPHWYWSIFGGTIGGPPLVNSKYINSRIGRASQIYSDGSAYASIWQPYGGNWVALGQFTNQAQMAGWKVDCSAFRGTPAQFFDLIGGNDMALTEDDLRKIARAVWALDPTGEEGLYKGLSTFLDDAATQTPPDGFAAKARTSLRTMLGLPIDQDTAAVMAAALASPLLDELRREGAGGMTPEQVEAATTRALLNVHFATTAVQ